MRLAFILVAVCAFAQVDERVVLHGAHRRARAEFDLGRVDPAREIPTMVLLLKRTPQQQAAIEKLLAQQQDPSSAQFHKWLTADEYASRFGVSPENFGATRAWLESQGLQIDHPARGRNWIAFRGRADRVERAFATELHRYRVNGEEHLCQCHAGFDPEGFRADRGRGDGAERFSPETAAQQFRRDALDRSGRSGDYL